MGKRKHIKQMSQKELKTLKWAILLLDKKKLHLINPHLMQRMHQKGVSSKDVIRAIYEGNVIEAHNKISNDVRILLRLPTTRGYAICVVVSLFAGIVITAYTNDDDDEHSSLDWSEYQWEVNLALEVSRFMKARLGSQPASNTSKGVEQNGIRNRAKPASRKRKNSSREKAN